MKKTKNNWWLKEHFSDTYVKKSKIEGYRARSVYKLIEINEHFNIIKNGMTIIDLGASPGSWSQYVSKLVGTTGKIIALDILPMSNINGVEFICGDFTNDLVVCNLITMINKKKVHIILSDLAPNLSGEKSVDQIRSLTLARRTLEFAFKVLAFKGDLIIKLFNGNEIDRFISEINFHFSNVNIIKPKASRARSSEIFLLARGFRGR